MVQQLARNSGLFNQTWRLLELPGRTRQDDDRMIHTAHAARDIAEDEERDPLLSDLETIPGQPRYW